MTLFPDTRYHSGIKIGVSTGKMQESSSSSPTGLANTAFSLRNSSYFHFWEEETKAIATHRWYLSEKAGRDVGDYANWSWVMHGHRSRWMAARASGLA